ncbi:Glycosyltransferase [Balamuthia mandrillaris]
MDILLSYAEDVLRFDQLGGMGNRRHKQRGERAPARGIPWEHLSLCLFALLLLCGALLLLVLVPRSKASTSNSPVPSSSSASLSGTSSSSSSASSSSSSFPPSSSRVNYNNNPFAAPIWYPDRLLQTASLPVTSFVVVIPVRNTASYIVNTLRSVKQSISHFFQSQQSLHTVSPIRLITNAEVVIVDDSSSDNSVARVLSFIHHQQHTDTKEHIQWKLVSSRQHLFRGTARNVGVTRSKGEVIFFLDADDVFHEDHVSVFAYFLLVIEKENTNLQATTNQAQTGVNVELDGIHPTWKQIIENTIPHNRCLYRTFHEFVEGFPEQPFFSQLEDVAYSYFISAAPLYRVQKETMTYKFYPGNTLDRNKEQYTVAPELTPPSPEENQLEHSGRYALTAMHYYHLIDKAAALSSGGEVLSNPFWAIFSYANGDNEKAKRFANANEWRSKKLSGFMEHEKAAGRTKRLNDLKELAQKYRFLNNTAEDETGGGMFEYCSG